MIYCKKMSTLALKHPPLVKGRRVASAQKKNLELKKHLGKVYPGYAGREKRFYSVTPSTKYYLLSPNMNRFRFSTNMNEGWELAVRAFNRDFSELPKRSPPNVHTLTKTPARIHKINKK